MWVGGYTPFYMPVNRDSWKSNFRNISHLPCFGLKRVLFLLLFPVLQINKTEERVRSQGAINEREIIRMGNDEIFNETLRR